MKDKEIQWGYYSATIKWEPDDWGDLSLYGTPTDNRDEFMVDRREGQLLGKYVSKLLILPYKKIKGRRMEADRYSRYGKSPNSDTWALAEKILMAQFDECGISCGDEPPDIRWDDDENEFYMDVSGYEILKDNLGHTMGRHEYRYFSPSYLTSGKEITQHEIDAAIHDWERWEDYNRGWWSYYFCTATIYKDGVEVASDCCGGIESDGGEEYSAEMEQQVLDEALYRAGIDIPAKELLEGEYEV